MVNVYHILVVISLVYWYQCTVATAVPSIIGSCSFVVIGY